MRDTESLVDQYLQALYCQALEEDEIPWEDAGESWQEYAGRREDLEDLP